MVKSKKGIRIINLNGTSEDIFSHRIVITRNRQRNTRHSVREGETDDFDVVEGAMMMMKIVKCKKRGRVYNVRSRTPWKKPKEEQRPT